MAVRIAGVQRYLNALSRTRAESAADRRILAAALRAGTADVGRARATVWQRVKQMEQILVEFLEVHRRDVLRRREDKS